MKPKAVRHSFFAFSCKRKLQKYPSLVTINVQNFQLSCTFYYSVLWNWSFGTISKPSIPFAISLQCPRTDISPKYDKGLITHLSMMKDWYLTYDKGLISHLSMIKDWYITSVWLRTDISPKYDKGLITHLSMIKDWYIN